MLAIQFKINYWSFLLTGLKIPIVLFQILTSHLMRTNKTRVLHISPLGTLYASLLSIEAKQLLKLTGG
jgi:hypothetical protein